ncbi:hypothetical protein PF005_g10358 [Phytophthora fragariae]|uniref:Uncharacterized protein n=1 Tax=Phytophthora fragariae TaxID=53985 RepID=A0A6A3Y6G5_9STRA|nr:hypothetical protein PF009_g18596 [Phytophthora fragariae]KAE8995253.1 hypothetical protein PF011_g16410 [Phytophthora fragariae]KAE9112611.1 hypothetical protein PF010_g10392 [Phytophthora fragariae]KAE9118808.1 hypothetical protein PF007_g8786 [Phytophthora fragariae]KAE9145588.1 hypothetical protein PF006_g9574 [Phytophthora fragariae]
MDEKETEGGDLEGLVDLMESELGTSSQKPDVSARSTFNAFLDRHVSVGMTLMNHKAVDVSKVMFGQFISFLLLDPDVAWQTSMHYVSSIKRQLVVTIGTKFSSRNWGGTSAASDISPRDTSKKPLQLAINGKSKRLL